VEIKDRVAVVTGGCSGIGKWLRQMEALQERFTDAGPT
jgi:NAD(P)-dependent dehydrogenase (short-subunit alcohol dehydrogenase family)